MDRSFHTLINSGRSTKITTALARNSLSEVAGTRTSVHCLPFGAQTEAFLGALVGLDFVLLNALGHGSADLFLR